MLVKSLLLGDIAEVAAVVSRPQHRLETRARRRVGLLAQHGRDGHILLHAPNQRARREQQYTLRPYQTQHERHADGCRQVHIPKTMLMRHTQKSN